MKKFSIIIAACLLLTSFSAMATKHNVYICEGSPMNLSLTTTSGVGPFTYQWVKNGTNVTDSTNVHFLKAATSLSDAGSYYCIYTDAHSCSFTSDTLVVTIQKQPIITSPAGASLCKGETETITINDNTIAGTYVSDNISILTVNANTGVVTAVAAGTANVTFTTVNEPHCTSVISYTVKAIPEIASYTATCLCTGSNCTFDPSTIAGNVVPTGTTYTWTITTNNANITGQSNNTTPASTFTTGNLNNTTTVGSGDHLIYTLTPVGNACTGSNFTVDVCIFPKATTKITVNGIEY